MNPSVLVLSVHVLFDHEKVIGHLQQNAVVYRTIRNLGLMAMTPNIASGDALKGRVSTLKEVL